MVPQWYQWWGFIGITDHNLWGKVAFLVYSPVVCAWQTQFQVESVALLNRISAAICSRHEEVLFRNTYTPLNR